MKKQLGFIEYKNGEIELIQFYDDITDINQQKLLGYWKNRESLDNDLNNIIKWND